MVDSVHAEEARGAVEREQRRMRGERATAVVTFLEVALDRGPVTVTDLESRARAAGLLGEMQRVTDAKVFKRAKKEVGITSRRDGFGRGGEWFWTLPTVPKTNVVETALNIVPRVPASVIYAGHSRPEQLHARAPRALTVHK
jgi:hypothetical protein